MQHTFSQAISNRFLARGQAMFWLAAALLAPGCLGKPKATHTSVSEPPSVQLIRPQMRKIVRVVGQPSFIESYERTSIYPKLDAYIEKWKVDIGDTVKKGDVLATLYVPELVEDFGTKKATVELDRERINRADKLVTVAEADIKTARASVEEAKAILAKFQAEADRWDSEVKRLRREVEREIVDPQILLESINQFKASTAARDAAKASIMKAEAELISRDATLAKARVDVSVARADLAVAQSEARRIGAWVGYLTLRAPYDGVIVTRNANTGDFVLPATGDPSAMERSPNLSHSGAAAPIYVVDRTDVVRIFVDVPEQDANYVSVGTKASVLVQAYRDEPISGSVTRTSWALNVKSRTLRAEIDLKNPNSQLLPGMYAYAEMTIERPGVRALPLAALTYSGDKTFCWRYENGRAVRTEIQRGVSDDEWVEVIKHRTPVAAPKLASNSPWSPIDGSEQVILGDLSILSDGAQVRVVEEAGATKIANVIE